MTEAVYYNEFNEEAAEWLCNLIAAGHLPDGVVDTRSIDDVHPDDLREFRQCHWFAGIGIWPLALHRAGWGNRPVWSGSCPCQPFSAAGKGLGFADERHLWPAWHHLIQAHAAWCRREKRRLPVILGEQVAGRDGLAWLDLVQTDLESAGYAVGKVVLSAAGYGADHIRERIFLSADAERPGQPGPRQPRQPLHPAQDPHREASGLVDALLGGALPYVCRRHDGHTNGVGQLRAYGNAIDVETARAFIEAVMEAQP